MVWGGPADNYLEDSAPIQEPCCTVLEAQGISDALQECNGTIIFYILLCFYSAHLNLTLLVIPLTYFIVFLAFLQFNCNPNIVCPPPTPPPLLGEH